MGHSSWLQSPPVTSASPKDTTYEGTCPKASDVQAGCLLMHGHTNGGSVSTGLKPHTRSPSIWDFSRVCSCVRYPFGLLSSTLNPKSLLAGVSLDFMTCKVRHNGLVALRKDSSFLCCLYIAIFEIWIFSSNGWALVPSEACFMVYLKRVSSLSLDFSVQLPKPQKSPLAKMIMCTCCVHSEAKTELWSSKAFQLQACSFNGTSQINYVLADFSEASLNKCCQLLGVIDVEGMWVGCCWNGYVCVCILGINLRLELCFDGLSVLHLL